MKPDNIYLTDNNLFYVFLSKNDNKIYSILINNFYEMRSCYNEVYNIYDGSKILKKLITTFKLSNLEYEYHSMEYYMNNNNKNEYLIGLYLDRNSYGKNYIIIFDITNNYIIKNKIQVDYRISYPANLLLIFPPNISNNYIIIPSTKNEYIYERNESTFITKAYLFETGEFIRDFTNTLNKSISHLIHWHNDKNNNDYVIQLGAMIINNLSDDRYYEMKVGGYFGFIYKENDVDYLYCNDWKGINIINLDTRKLVKRVEINSNEQFRYLIQWNERYLISVLNWFIIWDLEEKTTIYISPPAKKNSINLSILFIEKIRHPKYGESLIVLCGEGEQKKVGYSTSYFIKIWSIPSFD